MKHRIQRRRFVGASAALAAAALSPWGARAQAWPAKTVRVICAYPAGGLTDTLARVYSEQLGQKLGQSFIVENKPGASGMIGGAEVARAAPDGYTFLFTISTSMNQNRVLYKKMPYDPDKDFTYVSGFDAGHLPLAVGANVKAANMREFVELAKRERVTMGNYSAGSYPHMVAQQLNKLYGTQVEAVHYKGEAPMWADLASGQIHSALGSIGAMLPHMQSGKVRPIAVPTLERSPRLPEVPTYAEQGFKESVFVIQGWIGMFGPAGLPRDIVNRISAINQESADTPRISALNKNFGLRPKPWTAQEFEKLNAEVGPQWVALARELGVTLE
jgi:tripartite-type tricarboxylate transporter receptor subunit TctC